MDLLKDAVSKNEGKKRVAPLWVLYMCGERAAEWREVWPCEFGVTGENANVLVLERSEYRKHSTCAAARIRSPSPRGIVHRTPSPFNSFFASTIACGDYLIVFIFAGTRSA